MTKQGAIAGWRRKPHRLRACGATVRVLYRDTMRPAFDLVFYGDDIYERLMSIGEHETGGQIIHNALRRRGFDPSKFVCSPFMIEELRLAPV